MRVAERPKCLQAEPLESVFLWRPLAFAQHGNELAELFFRGINVTAVRLRITTRLKPDAPSKRLPRQRVLSQCLGELLRLNLVQHRPMPECEHNIRHHATVRRWRDSN